MTDWLHDVELHEDRHTDDDGQRRPLEVGDVVTCGTCLRKWCETCNPTPSARCPFEYEHEEDDEETGTGAVQLLLPLVFAS